MNDENINTGAEIDEDGTHFYVEFFCGVQWNRVEVAGPEDAELVARALRRFQGLATRDAQTDERLRIAKKVRASFAPGLFDVGVLTRAMLASAIEADDWGDGLDDLARPIEPKEG